MKRSRIFLGATASLLAIAGIVAAKSTRSITTKPFVITAPGSCKHWGLEKCPTQTTGSLTCKFQTRLVSGGPLVTVTAYTAINCINKLHYTTVE